VTVVHFPSRAQTERGQLAQVGQPIDATLTIGRFRFLASASSSLSSAIAVSLLRDDVWLSSLPIEVTFRVGIRTFPATFHPGNFNIPSAVDVAIMQRPALITSPLPHLKCTQPFWAACANASTNRTQLYRSGTTRITPPVAIDLHAACCGASTNRRRARTSPFPCLRQLLRARDCDVDLSVMPHETVRHYVEEMPTRVGDFCRQRPCANLLPAPLKHCELFLLLP
jgi:hypothetical protein